MTSVSTMSQSRIMRPTHRPLNMASVASTNNSSFFTLPSYMAGFLHELGPASGVYTFISRPEPKNSSNPSKANNRRNMGGNITGNIGGNTLTIANTANSNNSTYNLMSDRRVIRGNTYAGNIRVSPVNVNGTSDDRFKRDLDKRRNNNRRKMLPTLPSSRPASKSSLNIDSSLMGSQEERLRREDLARARVRRRLADNEQRKKEIYKKFNDDYSKENNKQTSKSIGIQVDLVSISKNGPEHEALNDDDGKKCQSEIADNVSMVDDLDEERSFMVSLLVANSKADALLELINEINIQST